jgi:hypothetical protein
MVLKYGQCLEAEQTSLQANKGVELAQKNLATIHVFVNYKFASFW